MTPNAQNPASNELALPSRWATEVEPQLANGEKIQAWLEIDLDSRLRFASGLLIVTDRRLLARAPGEKSWAEWQLRAGLKLNHLDHAGVGTLELHDGQQRLAFWRFTLAADPQALRLVRQFEDRFAELVEAPAAVNFMRA